MGCVSVFVESAREFLDFLSGAELFGRRLERGGFLEGVFLMFFGEAVLHVNAQVRMGT